jgi:hypothetical protein
MMSDDTKFVWFSRRIGYEKPGRSRGSVISTGVGWDGFTLGQTQPLLSMTGVPHGSEDGVQLWLRGFP